MAHDLTSPPARKAPVTLAPETWEQLLADWRAGQSLGRLARHYGVHPSTITARVRALGLQRTLRAVPPPLGDPEALARRTPVTDLTEAADLAITEILNAINAEDDKKLARFARIAAIVDKLKRGSATKAAKPDPDDDRPVFKPGRDVFQLLEELGLKPEDVL